MSRLEERLERMLSAHGVQGVTSEDVVGAIDAGLSSAGGAGGPLTAGEEDFLRVHGGPEGRAALAGRNPQQDAATAAMDVARRVAQLLAESISVAETAELLGVDRSRITRRCAAGTLWSFVVDGHVRLPRWQFAGNRPLPGLDVVIAGIPDGITPLMVGAVMATPQQETGDLTPIRFLAEGGAPAPVAEMLADLARW